MIWLLVPFGFLTVHMYFVSLGMFIKFTCIHIHPPCQFSGRCVQLFLPRRVLWILQVCLRTPLVSSYFSKFLFKKKLKSWGMWRTVRNVTEASFSCVFLRTRGRHHLGVKDYFWDSRDCSLKALDLQQIVVLSVISAILPVFFCSFILPLLVCDSHWSVVEGLMPVTGLGAGLAVTAWSILVVILDN